MTADRLREAAGWLQSEADWVRTLGLSWQREAAMAALLRAVAEDGPFAVDAETGEVYGTRPPTWDAALALADVIQATSVTRRCGCDE